MAEAFQRQVIYGGALDTILLEMELLGEAVLISAMGRASGLPTGSELPSRTALQAANVMDWFPLALCEKYRAVPSSVDGNVLRVLVTDPVDRKQLDELGFHLRRSIDPVVVPEHRFVQVVELVYGVAMSARFTSLAAKVRQRLEDAPTSRHAAMPGKLISPLETPAPQPAMVTSSTVAPSEPARKVLSDVPTPRPAPTEKMQAMPEMPIAAITTQQMPALDESLVEARPAATEKILAARPPENIVAARLAEYVGETRPTTDAGTRSPATADAAEPRSPATGKMNEVRPAATEKMPIARPVPSEASPVATQQMPALVTGDDKTMPTAMPTEHGEQPTPRITMREPSAPISVRPEMAQAGATSFEDPSPMALATALATMESAAGRDEVLEALCRGARSRLEFVALFMVHGENAVGRMALADHWLSKDLLGGLAVPLDQPSPFRTTVQSKAPYIGRLGEEGGVQTLLSLGRKPPLPAVLIPLVLKDRVVALLYGDRHGKALEPDLLTELTLATTTAARAFQRLPWPTPRER